MTPSLIRPANERGAILEAATILRKGGLVVFPTDTVYGVGAYALLPEAIEAIYRAKLRPRDKAIPLLLSHISEINGVARNIPDIAWAIAERFWPGGLTLVLWKASHLPDILCAGGESIAVRVPDHPVALALIAALDGPLAATSANLSGDAPAITAEEAAAVLGGQVAMILDGGKAPMGVASTVLDLTVSPPRILRQGAIAADMLAGFLARFGLQLAS